MKLLRFLLFGCVLMIGSFSFCMDSVSWKTSLWGLGQQVRAAASHSVEAGYDLLQGQKIGGGQKVGDFFSTKLSRDLHPMLWACILKDHTLREKVRRLSELRPVCKAWNGMLHEKRILKAIVPLLFSEGGYGPVLASSAPTLAHRSMLRHFITYGFVADPCRCEAIEQFLNSSDKKIMFLHGPNVIDIAEWSKIFAKAMNRKVMSLDAAKIGLVLRGFWSQEAVDLFFKQNPVNTLYLSDIDELCAQYEKDFRLLLQRFSQQAHCIVCSNALFNKIKTKVTNHVTGESISIVHTACPEDWQREHFLDECVLLASEEPSVCERRIILQILTENFMVTYFAPPAPEVPSALKVLARGVALLPLGPEYRPYFVSYLDLAQKLEEHSFRSVDAHAFCAERLDAISRGTENFSYNDLRLIFANIGRFFERADVAADGPRTHRITAAIVDQVVNELVAKKGTGVAVVPLD